MRPEQKQPTDLAASNLPEGEEVQKNISSRRIWGKVWSTTFFSSLIIAIIMLLVLIYTIVNDSFGLLAVEYDVDPATLADRPLKELSNEELTTILQEHVSQGIYDTLAKAQPFENRSKSDILHIIEKEVLEPDTVGTWTLYKSLFNRDEIEAEVRAEHPDAHFEFRSWLDLEFIKAPLSSKPLFAGTRTALLGSLWMIMITIIVAFPIGVGAAIYLEEYATDNPVNRLIQTNINNLAGVPSIIYGMLGLAIFVRAMEPLTSGSIFGYEGSNGRTIVSAGLTMALLILPIIIINAQEAIRAFPNSLRQASYGLGATKWQTIWNHVLPGALPGIMTGTILAVSRAVGETAPLIVVGASTFIASDPDGPFSKFTALPILIYQWTARPQDEFRNIAAAEIIVLLILLLTLNATAIFLRNHFRRSS
jgi:phosphate transport system permease protein